MDAAHALADLIEVSSQIEGAVLLGPDDEVSASTWDADRTARVAAAARALVAAAEESQGSSPLTQLHAAGEDGAVFCVREGDRVVAAVTKADPTVGLVFYDLRTTLRLAAEQAEAKTPAKPRARKPKKAAEAEPEPAPEQEAAPTPPEPPPAARMAGAPSDPEPEPDKEPEKADA
jgi:predicted regulator of Ras-like GTPase activity (Roadblock/LC7/MglB family)